MNIEKLPEKNLKMYGLQRSGTNYLAHVIELNFQNVRVWHNGPNERYWKHGPPRVIKEIPIAGYLLLLKNPFAWVVSYRKYCQDLDVFRLCELYNKRLVQYLDFRDANENAVFISYESILDDLTFFLDAVADRFDLEKKAEIYINEPMQMGRGGDNMRGVKTNLLFNRAYYADMKYLDDLTYKERDAIDVTINRHLLNMI